MARNDRIGILFVCLGNICRSPLAENVFRAKASERGVTDRFSIDSAGTGGWHVGESPDPRMRQVAERRGVKLTGRARQTRPDDAERFDYIVCMDEDNRKRVLRLGVPEEKVHLLMDFHPDAPTREVPDPYYGGPEGFDHVFDLVDRACDALLEALAAQKKS